MTYDPDRDARAPRDVNPNARPYDRAGTSIGTVMMLSLMALFIAFGFWFYAGSGEHAVTADDRPSAERSTTGAAAQEPPLPRTPTPPTVPSQPRQ